MVSNNLNQALKTAAELHFGDVDGRTKQARRFKEIYFRFLSELGRDPVGLPESTAQFLRRAATLAMLTEQEEARMARGEPIDVLAYVRASGALHRMLVSLGLEHETTEENDQEGFTLKDIIGEGRE